ncbi:MAG: hypothetical protein IK140_07850 [Clostridia bacterium]|nr:hypothetical protein [Clostridia bacterium]
MTKIEEFETHLIRDGITEDDYPAYEKHLNRVRGNFSRLQHCYTTAVQFQPRRNAEAVGLIEWGLAKYPDTWFSSYSAYLNIGGIYENCRNYKQAYDAYLKAAGYLDETQKTYRQHLAGNLLWMLLHIDGFEYSVQLEEYYSEFNKVDDFTKGFVNTEYRLSIAEIVICRHHKLMAKAKEAYLNAVRLSKPGALSRIQNILSHHQYNDTLQSTPESAQFLKHVSIEKV